jgi:hypothetical protein
MPKLSFQNDDHEWVAVSLQWGTNTKNFTLALGSPAEAVDTQGSPVLYAWKPDNEVILEDELDAHAVELTQDAIIRYGNPPQGYVPATKLTV